MGRTRFCCDPDLQGSSLNVALDMSSQYGDHSREIVFKLTSYNKVMGRKQFC